MQFTIGIRKGILYLYSHKKQEKRRACALVKKSPAMDAGEDTEVFSGMNPSLRCWVEGIHVRRKGTRFAFGAFILFIFFEGDARVAELYRSPSPRKELRVVDEESL